MATNRSGTSTSQSDEAADSTEGAAPIRIKKYANRRLYNTATSSYVTLEHLAQMVKEGQDFVVHDAKTGDEITRAVLTQIIVEEENKTGQNMLPIGFLRQLISLYGDNMQWMVPKYLEHSLETFSENQERMRQYMQNAVPGMFPFGTIDDVSRQNVAMFEQAMKMFSPFPTPGQSPGQTPGQTPDQGSTGSGRTDGSASPSDDGRSAEQGRQASEAAGDPLSDMHRRLDELQRQMEVLGQMGKTMSESATTQGSRQGQGSKHETQSEPASGRESDEASDPESDGGKKGQGGQSGGKSGGRSSKHQGTQSRRR